MLADTQLSIQQLLHEIRQYDQPIYFIDWCVFTALGMELHIPNLQFICATDTFAGLHPQVFVPPSYKYDHSLSTEVIINELLRHEEVIAFIQKKGVGKLLLWLYDEETERLATALGLEICLSPIALRHFWDNKANTNRLAEKAGVPCVPYVLSPVEDYAHLRQLSKHLGEQLVVQMPHGMSGTTTFFICGEADFEKHQISITNGEEMKIMKRIYCHEASQEACVTQHGIAVAPLAVELIGIPTLTLYSGGWCGAELLPNTFPLHIIEQAKEYTIKLGEQLQKVGYKGYFEPGYLIDDADGTLYLGEINMRFTGHTPLINNANIAQRDIPLLLLHLAEWLDIPYQIDLEALNTRWADPETLLPMSMVYFFNVEDTITRPLPTGIYKLESDGTVVFVRPALNPQAIQAEDEIFWLNTAGIDSAIEKGAELGGFFIRSNVTTDGHNLTPQASVWIKGLTRYQAASA